jgi:N-carbamoylputrescine amidase
MFWGSSFAAGPQGEWLCEMSSREGEEAVVDIDMRRTGEVRRAWPFLRDRRIDAYGGMDRRYIDDPCT